MGSKVQNNFEFRMVKFNKEFSVGGKMLKVTLKKSLLACLTGISCMALPVFADSAVEECSKELLIAYFPEPFLVETLKKFNVPQDQWSAITKELAEKDKDIIGIVEKKAADMNPNPLKDPQQRRVAVKIFRETLLESFTSVLNNHGIKDTTQIQAMLDDVQQQKAKRFAQCMEKHRSDVKTDSPTTTTPVVPATPTTPTSAPSY